MNTIVETTNTEHSTDTVDTYMRSKTMDATGYRYYQDYRFCRYYAVDTCTIDTIVTTDTSGTVDTGCCSHRSY